MWIKGDTFIFKCGWGVCTYVFTPGRGYDPFRPFRETGGHFTPCTVSTMSGNFTHHACFVVMLNDFEDQAPGWLDHLPNHKMWSIIANGSPSIFSNDVEVIPSLIKQGVMKKI